MTEPLRHRLRLRLRAARGRWRARFDGSRWLLGPPSLAGRRACILVTYAAGGRIARHTLDLAGAWHRAGYFVVLVIACDRSIEFRMDRAMFDGLSGVLVRNNVGYDFGSWSAAIRKIPSTREATVLALANDSVFGPFRGFERLLARVDASPGDVVGMTDSFEIAHHLQSYLVFYKPAALRSPAFTDFWHRLRWGWRDDIIRGAELPFLYWMGLADLRVDVLFPAPRAPIENPTLCRWRSLVAAGLPFVKVQLLRENPFDADLGDWRRLFDDEGYAPDRVEAHFGHRYAGSAAATAPVGVRAVAGGSTTSPPHDRAAP